MGDGLAVEGLTGCVMEPGGGVPTAQKKGATASQSEPVPSVIASSAAKAAGNHGSPFRRSASARRIRPSISTPTARRPGPTRASLPTRPGWRAAYCIARFAPAE
ncbi:hypothetical protein Smic_02270 [Streptomyces microflavus]|uniref:Uncharacterized protein n=1 Tax=Streptomyces microflavus TaxID=1919 RepID=A0A7J0CGN5_STRMI|nr:hypothetical protein Smic_02270 [Streptomyces microflavus]